MNEFDSKNKIAEMQSFDRISSNTSSITPPVNNQTPVPPQPQNVQPFIPQPQVQQPDIFQPQFQPQAPSMSDLATHEKVQKRKRFVPDAKPAVESAMPKKTIKKKPLLIGAISVVVILAFIIIKPLNNIVKQVVFQNYDSVWEARTETMLDSFWNIGDEIQAYAKNFESNNGVKGTCDDNVFEFATEDGETYIQLGEEKVYIDDDKYIIGFSDLLYIETDLSTFSKYVASKGYEYNPKVWYNGANVRDTAVTLSNDETLKEIVEPYLIILRDAKSTKKANTITYSATDFKTMANSLLQMAKADKKLIDIVVDLGIKEQKYYDLLNELTVYVDDITSDVVFAYRAESMYTLFIADDEFDIKISDNIFSIEKAGFELTGSKSQLKFVTNTFNFDWSTNTIDNMLEGSITFDNTTLNLSGNTLNSNGHSITYTPCMNAELDCDAKTLKLNGVTEDTVIKYLQSIDTTRLYQKLTGLPLEFEVDTEKLNNSLAKWLMQFESGVYIYPNNDDIKHVEEVVNVASAVTTANANAEAIFKDIQVLIAECEEVPNGAYTGLLTEGCGNLMYDLKFTDKTIVERLGQLLNSGYYCFVVKDKKVTYAAWSEYVDLGQLVSDKNIKKHYDGFTKLEEVIGTYTN